MPGGLQDCGEDIATAVEREVFEETGVRARFESIFGFRHKHGANFGADDMYFFCRMTALTTSIDQCPRELSACQWMNPSQLLVLADKGELFPLQAAAFRIALHQDSNTQGMQLDVINKNPVDDKWPGYGPQNVYHIPLPNLQLE
eukprot:c17767_g1_i1.p2 GENE.c17767_g1_i1~~c17767_g1_i1.p2  ORF type:complete len:144 (+),score=32.08 c17767_g1_i1:562-993(+)